MFAYDHFWSEQSFDGLAVSVAKVNMGWVLQVFSKLEKKLVYKKILTVAKSIFITMHIHHCKIAELIV